MKEESREGKENCVPNKELTEGFYELLEDEPIELFLRVSSEGDLYVSSDHDIAFESQGLWFKISDYVFDLFKPTTEELEILKLTLNGAGFKIVEFVLNSVGSGNLDEYLLDEKSEGYYFVETFCGDPCGKN